MIAQSRTGKLVAVLVALGLHGVILLALFRQDAPEMEGGEGAVAARLGAGFADLAAGTMTTVPTETTIEAAPQPEYSPAVEPDANANQPQETTSRLSAVEPTQTPQSRPSTSVTPAESQQTAERAPANETAQVIAPTAQSSVVPTLTPTQPSAPQSPDQPETQSTAQAPDRVEAATEEATSVVLSPRPPARPETIERLARTAPPEPTPQPAARGNSDRNARAGSATGTETATAARAASTGAARSAAAGNAAASNYPGEVLRRISRVRKPNVRSTGAAVIAFSIASNGGLSAASVARSSGSSQLDRAALAVVQRAAPFPPPPTGAKRQFSIRIEGR
ncbi:energy transducer TonB [Thalassococcus sp. S3]|uniref:energy transducer TonB n=1 Tax=Thalassococcus sp. S3 TaxID=2017482 RepID=UPI0010248FE9|nr:energy transducer TonB [Thalassococcus sp. S3]QBF30451.1 energy transducer TonB [Thalassococcus sp. S3]